MKDDVAGEIVLQMKNSEVDDFIDLGNEDLIDDKAVLESFVERNNVSLLKINLFLLYNAKLK